MRGTVTPHLGHLPTRSSAAPHPNVRSVQQMGGGLQGVCSKQRMLVGVATVIFERVSHTIPYAGGAKGPLGRIKTAQGHAQKLR